MEQIDSPVRVEEHEVVAAMSLYEKRAGPRDGISICPEVSALANILGVMWHEKVKFLEVPANDEVHGLLSDASAENLCCQAESIEPALIPDDESSDHDEDQPSERPTP